MKFLLESASCSSYTKYSTRGLFSITTQIKYLRLLGLICPGVSILHAVRPRICRVHHAIRNMTCFFFCFQLVKAYHSLSLFGPIRGYHSLSAVSSGVHARSRVSSMTPRIFLASPRRNGPRQKIRHLEFYLTFEYTPVNDILDRISSILQGYSDGSKFIIVHKAFIAGSYSFVTL